MRRRHLPIELPILPEDADELRQIGLRREADARTRTGDPFITSEVLYQLSYVGAGVVL
jgi:hypothetical protein